MQSVADQKLAKRLLGQLSMGIHMITDNATRSKALEKFSTLSKIVGTALDQPNTEEADMLAKACRAPLPQPTTVGPAQKSQRLLLPVEALRDFSYNNASLLLIQSMLPRWCAAQLSTSKSSRSQKAGANLIE
jgi:hypothetical protein